MRKKAFTLIEILIVIVIFWVGILAILSIMANSVKNFDTINMQTRATLLAKEGIDLAFHHRDSNLEQGYPRDYYARIENQNKEWGKEEFLWKDWNTTFKIGLSVDKNKNPYYLLEKIEIWKYTADTFDEYFKTFALELTKLEPTKDNTPTPYTYKATTETPNKGYARRIEFVPLKIGNLELLKVNSHVIYKRWSFTGEVVLESLLWPRDSER